MDANTLKKRIFSRKTVVVAVVFGTIILRFLYLGYSSFDNSELTVMKFISSLSGGFDKSYFIDRRKGPLQWMIAMLPYFLGANRYDELLYRLPFALTGLFSVYIFYKIVLKISKSGTAAIIATSLFSFNGFHVIFSRVVQYQSLNLLFSYLSVYLLLIAEEKKSYLLYFLSGLSLTMSFLAHWDAVFAVPLLLAIIFYKRISYKYLLIMILPMFVSLLFFAPYIANYTNNVVNQEYLATRVGMPKNLNYDEFFFRSKLFNPFVFIPVMFMFSFLGLLTYKKTKVFYIQLLAALLYFLILGRSPGSHVYNFYIPIYAISGVTIAALINKYKKYSKYILTASMLLVIFIFYQSYVLMVEHKTEYPFEQERILIWKTQEYTHENLSRHVFGFTNNAYWPQISDVLDNVDPSQKIKFVTNGSTSAADYYLNREEGTGEKYFVIGIKRPVSFINDYKFAYIKDKNKIFTVKDVEGDSKAFIYKVGPF